MKAFHRKPMAAIEGTCKACGISFIAAKGHRHAQPYCSRKCSQQGRKTGGDAQCKRCAKVFYVPAGRLRDGRGRYCSRECQLAAWDQASREAEAPGNYRRTAKRLFEMVCADCGYDEHPEIILIHHIDGDRSNGRSANLIPLCQNCHCLRHLAMSGSASVPSARRRLTA